MFYCKQCFPTWFITNRAICPVGIYFNIFMSSLQFRCEDGPFVQSLTSSVLPRVFNCQILKQTGSQLVVNISLKVSYCSSRLTNKQPILLYILLHLCSSTVGLDRKRFIIFPWCSSKPEVWLTRSRQTFSTEEASKVETENERPQTAL